MSHRPLEVFFDLETTGLDVKHDEILQLAAWCPEREEEFMEFMIPSPNKEINREASRVNGFTMSWNQLYRNGQIIRNPLTQEEGIESFFDFLTDIYENSYRSVHLIAHNGMQFDMPLLLNVCQSESIRVPEGLMCGYLWDSLPVLKQRRPSYGISDSRPLG